MSRLRRDMSRRKLDDLLSRADDEAFVLMAWATHAIQDKRVHRVRGLLEFPSEAATDDISSKFAILPWKIETLLNELLAAEKRAIVDGRPNIRLNCRLFAAMAKVTRALAGLENAQDGLTLRHISVLREMHRLGQRQFEWQRGFLSTPRYYRAGFVYGGPLTRAFFSGANGFTIDEFVLGCFALYALFIERPIVRPGNTGLLGIDKDTLDRILGLVTASHKDARAQARAMRTRPGHVAYKKSLFRTTPCLSFADADGRLRIHAPLPDLLVLRSTSGLFYDLVRAGDEVKNEIAGRFETYCREFLRLTLPSFDVAASYQYPYRKNRIDTPDVLVRQAGEVVLIVECKATRMSYEARFSDDPVVDARRGHEELAKGVFQIWRLVSHHRRGLLADERLSPNVRGIVLTLDTWLSMAEVLQDDVLEMAKTMATEKDLEILQQDRIPVVFSPVADMEDTVLVATERSFFAAVEAAATDPSYHGWALWSVHRDITGREVEGRPHPFADRVGDVFNWWTGLGGAGEAAEKEGLPVES